MADPKEKARLRALRFLAAGEAAIRKASAPHTMLLEAEDRGTIAIDADVVADLIREGTVVRGDGVLALSPRENAGVRAHTAAKDVLRPRQRELDVRTIDLEGGMADRLINHAESPLGQLARLKTRGGAPFLTSREFQAGERLRSDYTRGQIMPRMGANWVASVSSGRRTGGIVDLTDAALAARQRVDAAVSAVGPELAGVLVDVCCFLKGMELVESERGWPVRSAKVMLKTALGALARHYNPPARRGTDRPTLHWGADGYRPSLSGD